MANTRRNFLKTAAATAAGAAMTSVAAKPAYTSVSDATSKSWPIKLGVASYSMREYSQAQAIRITKALGSEYICIKSFHLPYYLSEKDMARGVGRFESAGLKIVGGGNNNIREDNDEHVEMFFKYAKSAHMPLLVIAPTRDNLERIEKFVKQYNVKVAIHNHGPEDKFYPRPSDALALIKDMDPRVGLCVDVGHTVRTGADVVQEIADAGPRVLDVHIKDLRDLTDKNSQCAVGEGAMPVVEIFKQLKAIKYEGYINLEYEINATNVVPGMTQSFAYMRGVLAGMEG
jgi:sugar phosphate isomerase/epimerase